jgi:Phosphotransferase enzyme family
MTMTASEARSGLHDSLDASIAPAGRLDGAGGHRRTLTARVESAALGILRRPQSAVRRRQASKIVRRVVSSKPPPLAGMIAFTVLPTQNDVVVALVRREHSPDCVLKIASRSTAGPSLTVHEATTTALRCDPLLADFAAFIPSTEWLGCAGPSSCLVETAFAGVTGQRLAADPTARVNALAAALAAIGSLHGRTSYRRIVDDEVLRRWVYEPLASVVRASGTPEASARAAIIAEELTEELSGREVVMSRIHGDFTLGNLIYASPNGALSGIVDWEASTDVALPEIDVVHLLMSAKLANGNVELDDVIPDLMAPTSSAGDLAHLVPAGSAIPDLRSFDVACSLLADEVEARQWVEAFLLASAASQILDDYLHTDPGSVARNAALRPETESDLAARLARLASLTSSLAEVVLKAVVVADDVARQFAVTANALASAAVGSSSQQQSLVTTRGTSLDLIPDLVPPEWSEGHLVQVARASGVVPQTSSVPNVDISSRSLVILAWLAHVSSNIGKARRYSTSGRWLLRNVDGVLARLVPNIALAAELDDEDALARIAGTLAPQAEPSRPRRSMLWPPVLGLSVIALWLLGLHGVDLNRMSDTGLVSVMRPPAYAALALLTASFMVTLLGRRPSSGRLAVHLVALIGLLDATPPLLYGTLRYSWAWKHLGIVEYIGRTHHVDPHISSLAVYHNWPGFFSFGALVTKLVGAGDAITIAMWAPLFFNLLTMGALVFLYRTLTKQRRVVWMSCWLFFVSNWVGQDYFSPQALTFVLYIAVLAVVVDRYVRRDRSEPSRAHGRAITSVIILCTLAIVTSHQLTPVMLVISLVALSVTRLAKVGRFALFAAAANLVWYATGARTFVGAQIAPSLRALGAIFSNADSSLHDQGTASQGEVIVSLMGRMTVAVLGLLAVIGFVRRWRRGTKDLAPAVLCLGPLSFIVLSDYGGEILFRIFLFSSPFLAYFAAQALLPRRTLLYRRRKVVVPIVACLVLLSGFLFGYFGKDRQYRFTSGEVAATRYLVEHAANHSLLVSATANYPNIYSGYERFTPVVVANEDAQSRARVLGDPAAVLSGWLDDARYNGAYVLLTTSQADEIDALGAMPRGSVGQIKAALVGSSKFKVVFSAPDSVVLTLAGTRTDTKTEAP